MKLASLVACGLLALIAAPASAATIFADDFESYADTAALGAVWSLGDGTLATATGNPGQSLSHPGTGASFSGANTNSHGFPILSPAAGETLTFSTDIYDDATSANKRTTAGLRKASGSNLIEMGMYNSPSHYAYRVILFGPGDPSWVAFSNIVDDANQPISNAPVAGWHRFQAAVTATDITFTLDLNSDGFINATSVVPIAPVSPGFDIIRLGGPSDLSSGGGGVNFDNVSLTLVPEPASLALGAVALGGLGFVRRRRM